MGTYEGDNTSWSIPTPEIRIPYKTAIINSVSVLSNLININLEIETTEDTEIIGIVKTENYNSVVTQYILDNVSVINNNVSINDISNINLNGLYSYLVIPYNESDEAGPTDLIHTSMYNGKSVNFDINYLPESNNIRLSWYNDNIHNNTAIGWDISGDNISITGSLDLSYNIPETIIGSSSMKKTLIYQVLQIVVIIYKLELIIIMV